MHDAEGAVQVLERAQELVEQVPAPPEAVAWLQAFVDAWVADYHDREHGGLITGLAADGAVIDTDKAIWLQGRAAWTFSTVHHTMRRNPEWLALARSCLDFIRTHGRGPGGKLYFTVTRDGKPLRMRRYVYSECFAAVGSAAYSVAAGDARAMAAGAGEDERHPATFSSGEVVMA